MTVLREGIDENLCREVAKRAGRNLLSLLFHNTPT